MGDTTTFSAEETSAPGSSLRRGFPRVAAQLAWLEIKRVARGWRWRALVIVAAFGAFWWRRSGFGPGRPVFFPLGFDGLIGFSALFGVAAALLGVDATSQVNRARATRLFDTRPLPDILLAFTRWGASTALVAIVAAGFLVEVFMLCSFLGQACSPEPLIAWWVLWWLPGIALSCAVSGALRAWIRNDAAAILISVALLGTLGAAAWILMTPSAFFSRFAPHLGLILPWSYALADVVRLFLLALAAVGLWAVGTRSWTPPTSVSSLPPYRRRALPTLRRILSLPRQWRMTDRWTAVASLVFLLLAAFAVPFWIREGQFIRLAADHWSPAAPPLPPELATSVVPRWDIRRIDANLGDSPSSSPRFVLKVENTTTGPLRLGSLSLSPVWGEVQMDQGGRLLRQGPTPDTWLFEWVSPLAPGSTATLALIATPRPGAARLHDWVWNETYAEWGRLGPWWPRANGFDLGDRRVVIPDQPVQFRLVLGKVGSGQPVCGSSRVEDLGDRWVIESTYRQSRIMPVIADYESLEQAFEGFPVRLELFPYHLELGRFLFDLYEPRFQRLRRALGLPPAPFVFHEAAVAPALPDPFALPSAALDSLVEAMPDVEGADRNTYPQFDQAFAPWLFAILSTWFQAAEGVPSESFLLRDSLVLYLHEAAFNHGRFPSPRQARERASPNVPFVPWQGLPRDPQPYDFREADRPALLRPWDEQDVTSWQENKVFLQRAESFHHLIRYLLGETEYAAFLRDVLGRDPNPTLTRREFLSLAQRHASRPLAPIVEQLLGPARLPTFEAREARLYLERDPDTRALQYATEVTVANLGQGQWPVPVLLETEDDVVKRQIDLGPGESVRLRLVSRSRPVAFFVDPKGWLPQIPQYDSTAKSVQHPRIFLKQVISRLED